MFVLVNVAFDKPTSQQQNTSHDWDEYHVWPANNAVDGRKGCGHVTNTTVTLSGYAEYPWWQVDLEYVYVLLALFQIFTPKRSITISV